VTEEKDDAVTVIGEEFMSMSYVCRLVKTADDPLTE
jgi:hypothetical protein